jgi:PilZ domain-containing protein
VDERRRGPRYPFFASAQITELQTKVVMTARTSELSRHGCYMDMLNPLPLGTPVKIQITYQEQAIDATGRVIYSQPNMGMGVSFDEMQTDHEALLEKWVDAVRGN